MSIAKKCDVCGKMYLPYGSIDADDEIVGETADISASDEIQPNAFQFTISAELGDIRLVHPKLDLCDECIEKLYTQFIADHQPQEET